MIEQGSEHNIYWTKDAFSMNHTFFEDGEVVGFIQDKLTNRSSKASLFGKKFLFEREGFFKARMNILDLEKKNITGRIDFHRFQPKAKILLNNTIYGWKFTNMLQTRWELANRSELIIVSADSRKEGYCTLEDPDTPLLLLSSLIIRNFFTKQGQA